jgi:hypothetical protein
MKKYLLFEASAPQDPNQGGFFQFIVCSQTFSVLESYYISSKETPTEPLKVEPHQLQKEYFTLKSIKLDPLASVQEMMEQLKAHLQPQPNTITDNLLNLAELRFKITAESILSFLTNK